MSTSTIDWLNGGETINPFTGCLKGCRFCYARKMAYRLAHIDGTVYRRVSRARSGSEREFIYPLGGNSFHPAVHLDVFERERERLTRYSDHGCVGYPRRIRQRRIFVGSMGDLCFDGEATTFDKNGLRASEDWNTARLQRKVAVFAGVVRPHTILLLTKRPECLVIGTPWPENAHLGVSVTGRTDAHRIETLLRWNVANRELGADAERGGVEGPGVLWASVEPLLDGDFDAELLRGLGWVVVGLQTGSGKERPGTAKMTALLEAVQRIVDWCAGAGVPCFVKDNARCASSGGYKWPRQIPTIET